MPNENLDIRSLAAAAAKQESIKLQRQQFLIQAHFQLYVELLKQNGLLGAEAVTGDPNQIYQNLANEARSMVMAFAVSSGMAKENS